MNLFLCLLKIIAIIHPFPKLYFEKYRLPSLCHFEQLKLNLQIKVLYIGWFEDQFENANKQICRKELWMTTAEEFASFIFMSLSSYALIISYHFDYHFIVLSDTVIQQCLHTFFSFLHLL